MDSLKQLWKGIYEQERVASRMPEIAAKTEGITFHLDGYGTVQLLVKPASAIGDNYMSDTYYNTAVLSSGIQHKAFVKVVTAFQNSTLPLIEIFTSVMFISRFETVRFSLPTLCCVLVPTVSRYTTGRSHPTAVCTRCCVRSAMRRAWPPKSCHSTYPRSTTRVWMTPKVQITWLWWSWKSSARKALSWSTNTFAAQWKRRRWRWVPWPISTRWASWCWSDTKTPMRAILYHQQSITYFTRTISKKLSSRSSPPKYHCTSRWSDTSDTKRYHSSQIFNAFKVSSLQIFIRLKKIIFSVSKDSISVPIHHW